MAFSDEIGLLFRLKGDSSDAVAALNRVQREQKDLETSTKGLGSTFSSFAGPAAIAAAGVTAVAAVAVSGTIALFKLAQSAAEFGSEIFRASEKTGLGAETLSSLKYAADQSGSSLETITAATARFAKIVGEAADGSDKAGAKLKKFGIDPQEAIVNLDGALEKVFKTIIEARPGVEQLTLAQIAFGRSGGDLIPVIKSFDGDMSKLIATAKELGFTLTNEDVKAANQFGDQLDTLNKQLEGVGRMIGQEVMPIFQEFARDISSWLKTNKGEVKSWAETLVQSSHWLRYEMERDANGIKLAWAILETLNPFSNKTWDGDFSKRYQELEKEAQAIEARYKAANTVSAHVILEEGRQPGASLGVNRPKSKFGTDDEDAEKEAERLRKEAEKLRKAREAAFKQELSDRDANIRLRLQTERDGFDAAQKDLEKNYIERNITEQSFLDNSYLNIKAYKENVVALIREGYLNDVKQATTDLQKENAKLIGNKSLQSLNKEVKSENADIAILIAKTNKEIAVVNEKERKEALKHWGEQRKHQQDTYDIQAEQFEFDEKERERKYKSWRDEIDHLAEVQRRVDKEADRKAAESNRRLIEGQGVEGSDFGGGLAQGLGLRIVDRFGGEDQVLSDAEFLKEVWSDLSSSIGQSIGVLAQGLANLVTQWLITGKISAKAALQMAAGAAIGLAMEAGMKALFQVAEGLAMAANPFTAHLAAGHFAAAKAYGVVAAIAGGIGVGAALGSRAFKDQTANGGIGSGIGDGPSGNSENAQNTPLNFTEKFNGFVERQNEKFGAIVDRANVVMGGLMESVDGFTNKFGAVTPGNVVMAGAGEAAPSIFEAFESQLTNDPKASSNLFRGTGQMR